MTDTSTTSYGVNIIIRSDKIVKMQPRSQDPGNEVG